MLNWLCARGRTISIGSCGIAFNRSNRSYRNFCSPLRCPCHLSDGARFRRGKKWLREIEKKKNRERGVGERARNGKRNSTSALFDWQWYANIDREMICTYYIRIWWRGLCETRKVAAPKRRVQRTNGRANRIKWMWVCVCIRLEKEYDWSCTL